MENLYWLRYSPTPCEPRQRHLEHPAPRLLSCFLLLLITLPLGAARGGSFAAGGGAALREEDLFRFEGRISCSSSLIHCWDARGAVSDFPGRRKRGWKEGSRWDFLAYVIVNKVVEVLGRDRGAAAAEHADLVAP